VMRDSCATVSDTRQRFRAVPGGRHSRRRRIALEARKSAPLCGKRLGKRRGWDSNPRRPVKGAAVFKTAPFVRSGTPPETQSS
jgi:hypothetical protein